MIWIMIVVKVCVRMVKSKLVMVKGMVIVMVEEILVWFWLFKIKIIVDVMVVKVVLGVIVVLMFD